MEGQMEEWGVDVSMFGKVSYVSGRDDLFSGEEEDEEAEGWNDLRVKKQRCRSAEKKKKKIKR